MNTFKTTNGTVLNFEAPAEDQLLQAGRLLLVENPWTLLTAVYDSVLFYEDRFYSSDSTDNQRKEAENWLPKVRSLLSLIVGGVCNIDVLADLPEDKDLYATMLWAGKVQGKTNLVDSAGSADFGDEATEVEIPVVKRRKAVSLGGILLKVFPRTLLQVFTAARLANKYDVEDILSNSEHTKDLETSIVYTILGTSTFQVPAGVSFGELKALVSGWAQEQESRAVSILADALEE